VPPRAPLEASPPTGNAPPLWEALQRPPEGSLRPPLRYRVGRASRPMGAQRGVSWPRRLGSSSGSATSAPAKRRTRSSGLVSRLDGPGRPASPPSPAPPAAGQSARGCGLGALRARGRVLLGRVLLGRVLWTAAAGARDGRAAARHEPGVFRLRRVGPDVVVGADTRLWARWTRTRPGPPCGGGDAGGGTGTRSSPWDLAGNLAGNRGSH